MTSQAESAPALAVISPTSRKSSAEFASISGRVVLAMWCQTAPAGTAAETSTASSGAATSPASGRASRDQPARGGRARGGDAARGSAAALEGAGVICEWFSSDP